MEQILIAKKVDDGFDYLDLSMANRHALIAGATGMGKTVTLHRMVEQFSKAGVPVFAMDFTVGRVVGIAEPPTPKGCHVIFGDLYGCRRHPLRTTVNTVGPLLIGRFLVRMIFKMVSFMLLLIL